MLKNINTYGEYESKTPDYLKRYRPFYPSDWAVMTSSDIVDIIYLEESARALREVELEVEQKRRELGR